MNAQLRVFLASLVRFVILTTIDVIVEEYQRRTQSDLDGN